MRSPLRFTLPLLALAAAACTGTPSPAGPSPVTLTMPGDTRVAIADVNADTDAESVEATAERVWAVLPASTRSSASRWRSGTRPGGSSATSACSPAPAWPASSRRGGSAARTRGAGPSAVTPYRVQLTVVTRLRPGAEGRTGIATQVVGTGLASDGTGRFTSHCVSTGRLEQIILAAIERRL